ncbi:MAG: hypothetical protein LBC20_15020, partial [Planctomycetaceae bacterium]|nr:hypothetical protein [Planctomycetaceae bacterium]
QFTRTPSDCQPEFFQPFKKIKIFLAFTGLSVKMDKISTRIMILTDRYFTSGTIFSRTLLV